VRAAAFVLAAVATIGVPSPALAQYLGRDKPHAGSVEVGGAFAWDPGYSAGSTSADLTRNPGTGTGPLELFQVKGTVGATPGVAGRVGVFLSSRWSIEGGVTVSWPKLTAQTSNDFEQALPASPDESLTRYLFDGSVVYSFTSGRTVPFVLGGAGYSRQLDSASTNMQTGNEVHGGGGVRYWFGSSGGSRFGVRVEARISSWSGLADLEGETKRRIVPTVSAGVTYVF
jgi:Outer membrane protein beta-barrel domain